MKELLSIVLVSVIFGLLMLNISPKAEADSTQVIRPPVATSKSQYCYGNISYQWDSSQWTAVKLPSCWSPSSSNWCPNANSVMVGVSRTCCDWSWTGTCGSYCCYVLCSTSLNTPKTNCKWE